MAIADTLNELLTASGKTIYQVAQEYERLRDGEIKTYNRYYRTVEGIFNNPGRAQSENLFRVFQVFGVDAESAIAIAASQVKPSKA